MLKIPSILFAMLCLVPAGCSRQAAQILPEKPPEVTKQEFTGPSEGWPPQPRGRTNVRIVASTPIAGSLTVELQRQTVQAAVRDARVKDLLGDRFAHISTDEVEPIKDQPRVSNGLPPARVTFFSHANNVAVEALVQDARVITVTKREGYQPPEGREEIEAAVALAQRDDRLQSAVQGLRSNAIVTFATRRGVGYGHRLLYVSFWKEGEDITRYFALVDLTDRKVLDAGLPAESKAERR